MLDAINADRTAANSARNGCTPNPHVLEQLLRLSAERVLLASADIVSASGETLWYAGQPASEALFESLRGQRLQIPLETCLALEPPVTSESAVSDALTFMQDHPALQAIGRTRGALDVLLRFGNQTLPPAPCLLLALMRTLHPRRYEQQLAAMVISAGLANALKLGDQDGGALVCSSLVCNVGELLLDSQISAAGHPPSAREWLPIARHPELGASYLKDVAGLSESVVEAVCQHHERRDGSGYPAQLTESDISPIGALTGLANVAAAVLARGAFSARYARVMGAHAAQETSPAVATSRMAPMAPTGDPRLPTPGEANRWQCRNPCARTLVALDYLGGEYNEYKAGSAGRPIKLPAEFPSAAVSYLSQTLTPLIPAGYPSVSGKYADLVMPVLQQIRASRLIAEVLARSPERTANAHIGSFALQRLRLIDQRLRAFELYEFSRWHLLEQSPQLMGKACLLLDEATWRLHDLARQIQFRAVPQSAQEHLAASESFESSDPSEPSSPIDPLVEQLVDQLDAVHRAE